MYSILFLGTIMILDGFGFHIPPIQNYRLIAERQNDCTSASENGPSPLKAFPWPSAEE